VSVLFNRTVRHSSDLDRILALPRRSQSAVEFGETIAEEMTELLKTPQGTQKLRAVQAAALHDIGTLGGLFGPIPVGFGKTLISLLAPYVLDAQRPLLVLPAALIKKTKIEQAKYAEHWRVPSNLQIISYEMLGRVQAATFLEEMNPDLVIFDEVHRAKNKRAAVTRRLIRYMRSRPNTMVVALSGTVMRKSLLDFGHILRWCLKKNAPIPETDVELEEWAQALDEKLEEYERAAPGALTAFSGGLDDLDAVRRGFKERLISTPGVVAVTGGEDDLVTSSLRITALKYNLPPEVDQHFAKLRRDMVTPDQWQLMQAVEVWAHARQMALGMFYRWNPRPPEPWRQARREWNAFVRETLSRSRTLDSELQVVQACDAGRLPNETLEAWRAIRDSFTPNVEPVWFDDSAVKVCLEWMKEPGIVWVEHQFVGQRLAELSGKNYYGAKGLTDRGEFIDDASPKHAVILSIDANKEGRNLQHKWSRNLITAPPEGADVWQQMLGRTHRPGQIADEVEVDVLLGCKEHANAWRRALSAAEAIRDTTGADSKLLLADVDWPSEDEIAGYAGARWR
jgi:hypothetical protein